MLQGLLHRWRGEGKGVRRLKGRKKKKPKNNQERHFAKGKRGDPRLSVFLYSTMEDLTAGAAPAGGNKPATRKRNRTHMISVSSILFESNR